MRLTTWNTAGRVRVLDAQIAALGSNHPDVIALQEVTANTAPLLRARLARLGLSHAQDSFSLCGNPSVLTGPRRYGQLVASRWPLQPMAPGDFSVPWPERILSVQIGSPFGTMELHTAGIPPGCTNGWTKIEMFEGIFTRLAKVHHGHRILCGDFNTPQTETADGKVVTWGGNDARWDRGERSVLVGLAEFDLADVFRVLNGYEAQEFSWQITQRGKVFRRRFDHVMASKSLCPTECSYLHALRESGLSDHSPLMACFDPAADKP